MFIEANLVQASGWMLAYTRNERSQVSPEANTALAGREFSKEEHSIALIREVVL